MADLDARAAVMPDAVAELVPERVVLPRWAAPVFGVTAVGLVPWVVILASELPRHALNTNYRLVWVGFDVGLLSLFAALGWLAFELPFAGLCLWLARNAERVRRHRVRLLGWRVLELERLVRRSD
jgi:hypothetical protein